jgi:hypothetical protein
MGCTSQIVLLGALCAASLAAGAEQPKRAESEREVSFVVRVCEGDEIRKLLGQEAEASWDDCDRPLAGVPVTIRSGNAKDGPWETGKDGVVMVGPIRIPPQQRLELRVCRNEYACLTLKLDAAGLQDGQNHFLYHTVPLKKREGVSTKP